MFGYDLEQRAEAVVDDIGTRAKATSVALATVYHEGRDVFPHSASTKVRFLESGAAFFQPDPELWRGVRLQLSRSNVLAGGDPLRRLCDAASERHLTVDAWTVYLHNDDLARRHPDCCPENVFGDRYLTELCPAHPDARSFAEVLSADLARAGVRSNLAESLHYHPFEHGSAHERDFLGLSTRSRFLLSLCFCVHCVSAAEAEGVDCALVRSVVRAELDDVLRERDPGIEVDRDEISSLAEGQMAGYLAAREKVVTSLVAAAASAAAQESGELRFIDVSGALPGPEAATGAPSIAGGWRLGIDSAAIAGMCALEVPAYRREPHRVQAEVEAYLDIVPPQQLGVILRPMHPDCESADNLCDKLARIRQLGVQRVDFYTYGFMRLTGLDWIRQALAA